MQPVGSVVASGVQVRVSLVMCLGGQSVIHPGSCAGSKDWSEHGIYGHRSGAGGDVASVFG